MQNKEGASREKTVEMALLVLKIAGLVYRVIMNAYKYANTGGIPKAKGHAYIAQSYQQKQMSFTITE